MQGFSLPATPLGTLWAVVQQGQVTQLGWGATPTAWDEQPHPLQPALAAYFQGQPLPSLAGQLAPQGTPFQQQVWAALLNIPHGQTCTYGQLAATVGSHPRAVGAAVGANPIPILIPCHRVLGTNGQLTGFSAPGGITSKLALLRLEGAWNGQLDV